MLYQNIKISYEWNIKNADFVILTDEIDRYSTSMSEVICIPQ